VKLARHPRALVFLRLHNALGHGFELAVGQPVFADIQRQPAGKHQQHRHQRHRAQRQQGAAGIAARAFAHRHSHSRL
jgi:hypothetical protein